MNFDSDFFEKEIEWVENNLLLGLFVLENC